MSDTFDLDTLNVGSDGTLTDSDCEGKTRQGTSPSGSQWKRRPSLASSAASSDPAEVVSEDDEAEAAVYNESIDNAPRLAECGWQQCRAKLGSIALLRRHLVKMHVETHNDADYGSKSKRQPHIACRYGSCRDCSSISRLQLTMHLVAEHLAPLRLICPVKGCKRRQKHLPDMRRHLHTFHSLDSSLLPRASSESVSPLPSSPSPSVSLTSTTNSGTLDIPTYVLALPKITVGTARNTRLAMKVKGKVGRDPFFEEVYNDNEPLKEEERLTLLPAAPALAPSSRTLDPITSKSLRRFCTRLSSPEAMVSFRPLPSSASEDGTAAREVGPPIIVNIRPSMEGNVPSGPVQTQVRPHPAEVQWSEFRLELEVALPDMGERLASTSCTEAPHSLASAETLLEGTLGGPETSGDPVQHPVTTVLSSTLGDHLSSSSPIIPPAGPTEKGISIGFSALARWHMLAGQSDESTGTKRKRPSLLAAGGNGLGADDYKRVRVSF